MPTTTPAAMPAVLGLLSSFGAAEGALDDVWAGAAEVAAGVEGFEDALDWGWKKGTSFRVSPVRTTQYFEAPPPVDRQ